MESNRQAGSNDPSVAQLTRAELEQLVFEREQAMRETRETLTAQNEEIIAMNEELVSQNEEITAMNEEIVTLNQKLSAINTDLERRVEERTSELVAAHQELLDLAGHGHRKRLDELHIARDLLVGDLALAEGA